MFVVFDKNRTLFFFLQIFSKSDKIYWVFFRLLVFFCAEFCGVFGMGKLVVGDIILVIDLGLFQHGFLSSVSVQESAQILMRMIVRLLRDELTRVIAG